MKLSLKITDAEIIDNTIVINKIEVKDYLTGHTLKVAKINDKLLELIKSIEIDADKAVQLKTASQNENFKTLVDKFALKMI